MRFSAALLPLLALPVLSQSAEAQKGAMPVAPSLKYLFTVNVNVTAPLAPIPVVGGVEIIEPVVGTIAGPALNGTITGGTAFPEILNNQTLDIARLNIYGNTTDGVSFFGQGLGIGTARDQIARIELDIGGRYKYLASSFILAEIMPNAARTQVVVNGFLASGH